MNIRELIESLEALAEEHGDETEVRLATQPSYPFEHEISCVEAVDFSDDEEAEGEDAIDGANAPVVYIGEGGQIGYLPGAAASTLGWR